MTDQPDEILAIDEVAACLRAGQHKVYPKAAKANLSGFKLGKPRRTLPFRRDNLAKWIADSSDRLPVGNDEGGE